MKEANVYTPAQFAEKHNISRTTIWRWLRDEKMERRLKMYDAKKIVIAEKVFIEVL
jgi:AmiR/NasT family two-component response regulator